MLNRLSNTDTLFAQEVSETEGLWPYSVLTLFYICPRYLNVSIDVDT